MLLHMVCGEKSGVCKCIGASTLNLLKNRDSPTLVLHSIHSAPRYPLHHLLLLYPTLSLATHLYSNFILTHPLLIIFFWSGWPNVCTVRSFETYSVFWWIDSLCKFYAINLVQTKRELYTNTYTILSGYSHVKCVFWLCCCRCWLYVFLFVSLWILLSKNFRCQCTK